MALEHKYGDKVDFIIADVEVEKSLVDRYQVLTIPAYFIIDRNGSVIDTAVGKLSEEELEAKIGRIIK